MVTTKENRTVELQMNSVCPACRGEFLLGAPVEWYVERVGPKEMNPSPSADPYFTSESMGLSLRHPRC